MKIIFLFKVLKIVFLFLVIFLPSILVKAQEQECKYNDENIETICSLITSSTEDKKKVLFFKFSIINKSEFDVFMVAYSREPKYQKNVFPIGNHIIEFGGYVSNLPRFWQPPIYRKISKEQQFTDSLIVTITDSVLKYTPFLDDRNFEIYKHDVILISLFFGYYFNNEDNNLITGYMTKYEGKTSDNDTYNLYSIDINKGLFGLRFDKYYKRKLCVFPIVIEFKK